MATVSNDFKNAIKASTRQIKGYCLVKYNEEVISINANVPEQLSPISDITKIYSTNGIVTNYATLEKNYFKTDGSMILPNINKVHNQNIGYISQYRFSGHSGSSNLFDIFFEVLTEGLTSISIYFGEDYPINYDLVLRWTDVNTYNEYETVSIINNDKNNILHDFSNSSYYLSGNYYLSEIELRIYKFSNPEHRVRINGLNPGLIGFYKDRELISMTINEETDVSNLKTPTSDCSIILNNYDDKFDILNENGLYKYLKSGVEIIPYIGCITTEANIEYQQMGLMYLNKWSNNDDGTTTLSGQNILSKLQNINNFGYRGSSLSEFFNYCGIEANIENNVPNGVSGEYLKDTTAIEYLQLLLTTSGSYMYIDKEGKINVEVLDNTVDDSYSLSNFSDYPKIETSKGVQKVILNTTIGNIPSVTPVTFYSKLITHDTSGITKIFVNYDTSYLVEYDNFEKDITVSTGTITSAYVGYNSFEVTVSSNVDFTLEAKGYEITNKYTLTYEKENVNITNGDIITMNLPVDGAVGEELANRILANSYIYKITTSGQQDPSIISGHLIAVETKNGYKNIRVNKLNYKFDGSLTGTIEGVGN